MDSILDQWQRFLEGLPTDASVRPIILESWQRSRSAGVDPTPEHLPLHRLPDDDLQRRLIAHAELLAIAQPHLEWVSSAWAPLLHVVALTDAEGIVLYATGRRPLMDEFRLVPGWDWSEQTMGTNGVGTALATHRPVAVVGPEHFCRPLHECACAAAPLHAPDDKVIGAIAVTTRAADTNPERIVLAANIAYVIHRQQVYCQMAQQAEDQAAMLRSLFDQAHLGIALFDTEMRYAQINVYAAALIGHKPQELIGRTLEEVVTERCGPEAARNEVPRFWHTLATGESYSVQDWFSTVKHRSGEPFYSDWSIRRLARPDGSPLGVLLTVVDVTQHELRKRALRESEARLRTVIDSNMIGIFFWDAAGNITDANDAFLRLVGYSQDDLQAGHVRWTNMTPPEYRQISNKAVEEIETTGLCTPFEKEYFRKDGSRVPVLLGGALLRGMRERGVAFVLDLTERKKAEEALRQTEERLRQSQKMEAIGRLAGGVAHDFNNLLTAITGYSDLMRECLRPPDPLYENVQEISKAAERAASLTRQLLAFSRKQILEPKVLDLNALVSEMDKMLRRMIGEDVELHLVLEPRLGRVKADPGQLEQVIVNLAINARDAMPHGGKLTIETSNVDLAATYTQTHPEVRSGRYVLLAVSDTGIGMDEQTKARIFEPFFTTKEVGRGTGLGLATVYGIVKQSGGSISVYSEVGQGAALKIYLPRIEEPAEKEAAVAAPVRPTRGTETILLVEDEEIVRNLARTILRSHGYTVLEARHGGEALILSEQHSGPIHLLVTDVVMPQMSGRQLAERLAPLRPQTKVLYLSGYTDAAVVEHGVLEKEAAFLHKPFTPDALARKVRDVLDQRG